MSRRLCVIETALLLTTLLCAAPAEAQLSREEAQIKAAFVYNFLKFVEWPAGTFKRPNAPLVVGIIGGGSIADAAEQVLATKRVRARRLVVRRLKWDESLRGVHVVFVAENDEMRQRRICEAAASEGVLSIGEGSEFAARGGVIGLLIEERKVRFDIDTGAAGAAGLIVSSKLLALARVVHSSRDRADNRQ